LEIEKMCHGQRRTEAAICTRGSVPNWRAEHARIAQRELCRRTVSPNTK
jgi:hypothetical protein